MPSSELMLILLIERILNWGRGDAIGQYFKDFNSQSHKQWMAKKSWSDLFGPLAKCLVILTNPGFGKAGVNRV